MKFSKLNEEQLKSEKWDVGSAIVVQTERTDLQPRLPDSINID